MFICIQDKIEAVAKPGNDVKPKRQRRPATTTNEIFPRQSPNNPYSADPPQKPQTKCKSICDDSQIFGDFVASALRNFNSDQNKRKLKLRLQDLILEATKDDEYLSFVLNPDTTVRTETPNEDVAGTIVYNPDIDEPESSIDVRFKPSSL